ncbi:aminoglycoside phosphotransferase family protein [Streptomyces sp. NPDC050095]|uniref:aminoglycoside phosphotransferase family protein n=1 Tax=unclassified Streptomyces TaxID=2593676 RepID=UPI0034336E23
MTVLPELPEPLHRLVITVTDSYTVLTEHQRPSNMRPSVWEIQGPGQQRWFAKEHVGPKLHGREVDAYTNWTYLLGDGRAPQLAAADPATRTVVITAVPGHSLDDLRLPAAEEREAYRQAGALLARLHAAVDAPAAYETTPVTDPAAWTNSVERLLNAAAPHLPAADVSLLRALLGRVPPQQPLALTHGDYMPKNWLWDSAEQFLRIIDFERTCRDVPARIDFARLTFRRLRQRPDLENAFWSGFGRSLSDEEELACRVHAAVDALDSLVWGIEHHDLGLVEEAHTMVENLRHVHARHLWAGGVA